jgi:putative N6-adenine-specific DNA methylase
VPPTPPLQLYAITPPGLEALTAGELKALGITTGEMEPGGVAFTGTNRQLYVANLHLRTASRILLRVAEFPATSFAELERQSRQVEWERYVAPGTAVRFRVTCRKSRLYHSDAVAERLASAVAYRVAGVSVAGAAPADDDDAGDEAQLFVVRMFRDQCLISADTSGAHLHQRGYRLAVAKAPMRETLAAAMLLASGWREQAPLLDPLCGSGTIAIEGALLARRIPPGHARHFACERWPGASARAWQDVRDQAATAVLPSAPGPILGSDRDAGAVKAAQANAARAGVADDIEFRQLPLSDVEPPPGPGWLVTNPPYGHRLGDVAPLRDLYARLGVLARARCPGWTLALLGADRKLEAQLRLPLTDRFRTNNGGIPVRVVTATVPGA